MAWFGRPQAISIQIFKGGLPQNTLSQNDILRTTQLEITALKIWKILSFSRTFFTVIKSF